MSLNGSGSTKERIVRRSNWIKIEEQPLSSESLADLFSNRIPALRVRNFLSAQECERMVNVIQTQKIIDKEGYFRAVAGARQLQSRFASEAGVDVLERVRQTLQQVSGIPVRTATEGDREYFAGILRIINSSALIHADYAEYDAPSWEIGKIVAQITWNVLLKQVQGGESIVYDRHWRGKIDDETIKKPSPSYGYHPSAVENEAFKVLQPVEGELTFFNSRNFHEVKALDKPHRESRYTMSSFVGLLPSSKARGPKLIMWS
ncbi:hypothetical protein AOQ84DRAFT_298585 [Glonium stellatum]|uniref:Prolyl 4-hydroxylase alpha subunit Fe(2+) 2OG dioxygenase domain-containing protein n=1 Tax=Glonium stellatum TaxID=574774 RepID=A0A8E2JQR4_9PEZI|nr:hypothetical protein AOQ84DRAFT_298585 [Glonium stellatum]